MDCDRMGTGINRNEEGTWCYQYLITVDTVSMVLTGTVAKMATVPMDAVSPDQGYTQPDSGVQAMS